MIRTTPCEGLPSKFKNTLFWLWGSWIVTIIIKALQHQSWQSQDSTAISLMLIILHSIAVTLIFLAAGPPKLVVLIIGAYFTRLFTMLADRFVTLNVPILGSDGDAEGFFRAASAIANDLTLAGDTYGGAYTAVLGYLFYFIGPDRLLGQYFNVLLGVTTVIFLAGILRQLHISHRITLIILSLAAFMPMIVVYSSVLLRETLIQVLVTAALFAFLKGLLESKFTWTVVSILLVLGASVFHAGVVGVLIALAFASAFTYKQNGRFKFGLKQVAPAMILGFAALVVLLQYPELFLGKFQTLESPEDLLDQDPSGRGGSAYLTGLEVDSWLTFTVFAPIRAIYFIASPLPWDWRGANDMFSFGVDSIVYLAVVGLFFIRKINDPNRRYLATTLALILIVTCLIFGVGVSNAGTAIRHRSKVIGIFLVLLAIVLDSTREKLSNAAYRRSVRKHGT